MSTETDSLLRATLDGRFRLDRLLGEGGMGRVYQGTQLSVGRKVAVKVILDSVSHHPTMKRRFLREAQLVATFTHPSIVRLIDFGEDPDLGLLYLVMDFVRGETLSDIMEKGPLRWDVALRIIARVAQGLEEAHALGVVHRDLKPDNFMITITAGGTAQPLILDFGVAQGDDGSGTKLTDVGAICGTPQYMAPEQARSAGATPVSDLYALGAVLFELMSGQLPIEAKSAMALMVSKVNQAAPPVTDVVAPGIQIPPAVVAFTARLLEREPSLRPQSASAVVEEIAAILGSRDFSLPVSDDADDPFQDWRAGTGRGSPSHATPAYPQAMMHRQQVTVDESGFPATPIPAASHHSTPAPHPPHHTPYPTAQGSPRDPSQRVHATPATFPPRGAPDAGGASRAANLGTIAVAILAGFAMFAGVLFLLPKDEKESAPQTAATKATEATEPASVAAVAAPEDDPPPVAAAPAPDAGTPVPSDAGTTRAADATSIPENGSPGCGREAPEERTTRLSKRVDSQDRAWLVKTPEDYDPNTPHRILLIFHQQLRTAKEALRLRDFDEVTAGKNVIVVAPEAIPVGFFGDVWSQQREPAFVKEVLRETSRNYCVDVDWIYAVGSGAGAFMGHRLACEMPLSAIGGSGYRPRVQFPLCEPVQPTPFIDIWGDKDHYLPRKGGAICNTHNVTSLGQWQDRWRDVNDCTPRRSPYSDPAHGKCHQWECEGAPLVNCEIDGGHEWAGESPAAISPTCQHLEWHTTRFDFPATIWKFLEENGKPVDLKFLRDD